MWAERSVEDYMNLLRGRTVSDDCFEKGKEVLASVASRGFGVHAGE